MRRLWKILLPPAAFLAMLFAASAVQAQSCSFNVDNIDFGNIDTLSGAGATTTGTVSVTCQALLAPVLPVRVCLNINAGSGGSTSGIRHMRNPGNAALDFNFFQDAAHQIPWGSREQPALGGPSP